MTLNAIATALEGRGDQIGENLETVDSYLKRLNPQIPALVEDLRLTAQFSDIYADVLPEVGTILQNTVTTTGTLEDREAQLNALFTNVSNFSASARTFLDDNESNMIRLGEVSRAQLRVLSRYSTEFPCLLEGIVVAGERQAEAFRGFTLHIVLETLPNQPRPYGAAGRAASSARTAAPPASTCPTRPARRATRSRRQPDFKDGVDEPTGKGTQRAGTGYARARRRPGHQPLRHPGLRRQHGRVRPAPRPARAGPRPHRRRRPRPRRCSSWARWPAAPPCRSASRRGARQ